MQPHSNPRAYPNFTTHVAVAINAVALSATVPIPSTTESSVGTACRGADAGWESFADHKQRHYYDCHPAVGPAAGIRAPLVADLRGQAGRPDGYGAAHGPASPEGHCIARHVHPVGGL
eukprot:5273636-Pyramimonas_sp.AAC.1